MNKFSLKKLDNGDYVVCGMVNLISQQEKSVIVDGETYYKTINVQKKLDLEQDFNENLKKRDGEDLTLLQFMNNWNKRTFNLFSAFGINDISIWDFNFLHSTALGEAGNDAYSENWFVNGLMSCFDLGMFDNKIIKKLYTQKHNSDRILSNSWEYSFKNNLIEVIVYEYGWGNEVVVEIPIRKFLSANFKLLHPHQIQQEINYMLPQNIYKTGYLTEKEKLNTIQTFYKKQIEIKNKNHECTRE